ncbi:hypothetical protein [Ehrlichia canis]|uniref:hypothetical protein n=1 Tax=Ehrlichia canis TaxID=944 RepID=UPI000C83B532|nr:hypothetical protein [Ehrlichia canis]AUO54739.1 hypothetical protein C1I72_02420 [Ehrlichia canis]UKC53638.1 hypothetical protein s20019040002_000681 [Ehrlichia canis]UKC54576.1 hypothetical protein s20026770001_000682 [Ehrlichia canis]UKC55512.1 hypothetical protein s21009500007_000682 [Ehrlichia canis]
MDLTLLVLSDGKILLYPTDRCGIRRRADGKIKSASMVDSAMNARLGTPNPQSTYAAFHNLFLSRFQRYCIMTSERLPVDMMCLFGYSGLLSKATCLFTKIPKNSFRDLLENGSVLPREFLVGCGIQAEQHDGSQYKNHAIEVFNAVKNRIQMNFNTPMSYNHILSFYDSEGALFHTEIGFK